REQQIFSDMWLLSTYLRLSKSPPEAVLTRAQSEPHGEWPRPARALLAGKLRPDEMLKLLKRKTGEERKAARGEAFFFLGEYYLGHGDPAKARDYFEKTRQLNVITFLEHAGAGFELRRIGSVATTSAVPLRPEPKKKVDKSVRKEPTNWTNNFWK